MVKALTLSPHDRPWPHEASLRAENAVMKRAQHILAIDQGTTSTKAIVIDCRGRIIGRSRAAERITPRYPRPGWVEYDPAQILDSVCQSARSAVSDAGISFEQVAGIGLANQGETVIAFDADSGEPIHPAISWQDRRGEAIAEEWEADGLEGLVHDLTGLRLDPYFSAPKLAWIAGNVGEAASLRDRGRRRMGTSDSWLLWQLTGGECFVTDAATASRTMLMGLADLRWSDELAGGFELPIDALPEILPNAQCVGTTRRDLFGLALPITGLCVDQQAALFGHGCHQPGRAKATYGTGCFVLTNTGTSSSSRAPGLLTCVAWQAGERVDYAFDGGVYSAGSMMDWLIELGLAQDVHQLMALAESVTDTGGVVLIPAFGGLAAPYWQGRARGCWAGMSQNTGRAHLVRAAVEAIAFRVRDIVDAMNSAGTVVDQLHTDGGLTRSDFLMQSQADVLNVPVQRSRATDLTALGVGLFAGLGAGLWSSPADLPMDFYECDAFSPRPEQAARFSDDYERWHRLCMEVAKWADAGLTG